MMRFVAVTTILLSPIDANRVNHHSDGAAIKSDSGAQFFYNSCEELQNMFRYRVTKIHKFIEKNPDEESYSRLTHAKFTLRTFGAIRILRRAKECPWVVDGNEDDLDMVRGVAHLSLAANPCGDGALRALIGEGSPENELLPLQNSVQILFSQDCNATAEGMAPMAQTQSIDSTEQLMSVEDEAQDSVDELMDAAEHESDEALVPAPRARGGRGRGAASFVQTEVGFTRMSRLLGAVFLSILYLLSCAATGAITLGLLAMTMALIPCSMSSGPAQLACLSIPMFTVPLGAAAGFVKCGVSMAFSRSNTSLIERG